MRIYRLSEELLQLHRQRQVVCFQCTTHECIHRNHWVFEHCFEGCTIGFYGTVCTVGTFIRYTVAVFEIKGPGTSTFDDN